MVPFEQKKSEFRVHETQKKMPDWFGPWYYFCRGGSRTRLLCPCASCAEVALVPRWLLCPAGSCAQLPLVPSGFCAQLLVPSRLLCPGGSCAWEPSCA